MVPQPGRPASQGQGPALGGLRHQRSHYRSANGLWTNKDWSINTHPVQGALQAGSGLGDPSAGESTQQGTLLPARLNTGLPVIVGNDLNPQAAWVPVELAKGPETVQTPTDRRVSTRAKTAIKFYQAGTDGKV